MVSKTLVPLKQALVPFYGSMILAVLLPDGRIAASLKSLCSMLKLARHGQMERIRNDARLLKNSCSSSSKLLAGRKRQRFSLPEAYLPG